MSTTMLSHASVLPSITCSTCNQEIQLSMLGEHVCFSDSTDSSSDRANAPRTDHDRLGVQTYSNAPGTTAADPSYSPNGFTSPPASATTLPTISEDEDHAGFEQAYASEGAVNYGKDLYLDHGYPDRTLNSPSDDNVSLASRPITPGSMGGQMRSPSPLSSVDGRSVGATSPRSPNFPLRVDRPPSPDALAQEPVLPSPPPQKAKPAPEPLKLSPNPPAESTFAPPHSPRLMDRMNALSPGPFARSLSKFTGRKVSQDKIGKMGDKKESFGGSALHISSPSITSISGNKLDEFGNKLPSGPPPPRPPRPEESKTPGDVGQMSGRTSFRPDSREGAPDIGRASSIYPSSRSSTSSIRDTQDFPDYLRQKATALAQIKEIEGPEQKEKAGYQPPYRPTRSRSSSPSSTTQGAGDTVPPLPTFNNTHNYDTRRHTPTESTSSTGSRAGFDDYRTESSRSSPPTSHNSTTSPQNLSVEEQNSRPLSTSSDYSLPSTTYQPPPRRSKNIGVDTNMANANSYGGLQPPQISPGKRMIESPAPVTSPSDPIQEEGQRLGPFVPPPRTDSARGTPRVNMQEPSLPQLDTAPKPARVRSKGTCRGCSQPIVGKSIRAADGRLTGRYHKECFICKHCSIPFPSMSFYVFRDHPYCAQHYHTLNNSLCHSCNSGIEGRYAETDTHRKFHLPCFCCRDCGKPLALDYYEVNGAYYCEADASRAHQKLSPLNPGRRFPERRVTRLGMI